MKVLIVEDDEATLEALTEYLCETRECVTADTADEAVSRLLEGRPDVILLDAWIKRAVSTEVITTARALYSPPPRIILMSALMDGKSIAEAFNVEYIQKPLSLFDLEAMLSDNYCQLDKRSTLVNRDAERDKTGNRGTTDAT